jgi:hypothetical protein
VPHLLRHGTSVFKVISERPVILPSEGRALGEGAITTYVKRLTFDAAGPSGARTHDLPFGTRLRQPVFTLIALHCQSSQKGDNSLPVSVYWRLLL